MNMESLLQEYKFRIHTFISFKASFKEYEQSLFELEDYQLLEAEIRFWVPGSKFMAQD